MKKTLLALSLVGLMVAGAPAESFNFAGAGADKTLSLKGSDEVNVSGSSNKLILQGSGDDLNVMGSSNQLTVKAKLSGGVNVMGSSNTITIDGEVDSVDLVGSSNKIVLIKRQGRELPNVTKIGSNNTVTEQEGK